MQHISFELVIDYIKYIEHQTAFIIRTTSGIHAYTDFSHSDDTTMLYNSTCFCLYTIGDAIEQVDKTHAMFLCHHYPQIHWQRFVDMSNIIIHQYQTLDPELVFSIVQEELPPLLDTLHHVISDLEAGQYEQDIQPQHI